MAFFDDLFGAITGQQTAAQQTIIPTGDLLAQSGALLPQMAQANIAYNQALAPGLTDIQLGVANQLDPSILGNFRGANASILDQLNLGSSLGQELQDQVIRTALQGNTASGFGASAGGRGLVARDLGLTGLDLLRQRQQDALRAGTGGLGVSGSLFQPRETAQLQMGLAGDIQQVQAARDEAVNVAENIRQQNFASLLNTGGKILGTAVGAAFGGGAGAQIGGSIGGSIFQGGGVAGQPRRAAGGGGFDLSSIMGMFGGGGAGQPVGGGIGGGSSFGGGLSSLRS